MLMEFGNIMLHYQTFILNWNYQNSIMLPEWHHIKRNLLYYVNEITLDCSNRIMHHINRSMLHYKDSVTLIYLKFLTLH